MSDMMSMMVISGITSIGSAVVSIIGAVKGFHCTKIDCCYGMVQCEASGTGASADNEFKPKNLLTVKAAGSSYPPDGASDAVSEGTGRRESVGVSSNEEPRRDTTGETVQGMSSKTQPPFQARERVIDSVVFDTDLLPAGSLPPADTSKSIDTVSNQTRLGGLFSSMKKKS